MALDLSHGFFFLSPSPPASSHPLCVIPCPNPRLLPPQNPHPIRPLVTCHTSHRSICNSSPPSITTMPRSAFRTFALPDSTSHTTGSVLPGPQNALHGSNTAFPPPSQTETASRESGDGNYFSDTILIEESDEKMERSAGGFYSWEDGRHMLAKLSEGQVIDGRLECLYHGWQFEGDGQCVKIPQLPKGAKIPNAACVRSFPVCDVQEVVWVWMGTDKSKADTTKIPRFDQFDDPNNRHFSSTHALPYDHSILLENLMDPAHIPISHDRTDFSSKRENAEALKFEITERTSMGFAGRWGPYSKEGFPSFTRFQAPCVLSGETKTIAKDGSERRGTSILLCRPSGQGKSMLIVRFGFVAVGAKTKNASRIPEWVIHQVSNKVLEQDMGFLASQNEVLMREKVPTSRLYLNLRTSDVFVMEYRKWLDKVGHGMPYYFGHKTLWLPSTDPIVEAAPAGLVASIASSQPMKGATTMGAGLPFSSDPTNRYFRHVVHCAMCRKALKNLLFGQKLLIGVALLCGALGTVLYTRSPLRFGLILSSVLCALGSYACQFGINMLTTNTTRPHRQ